MPEAVIVSTARTPIGRAYRGAFNDTQGQTLAGHVDLTRPLTADMTLLAAASVAPAGAQEPGGASPPAAASPAATAAPRS